MESVRHGGNGRSRSRAIPKNFEQVLRNGTMSKLHQLFEEASAFAEDNLGFVEGLYEQFLRDPESVDGSWRDKFHAIQQELPPPGATGPAVKPEPQATLFQDDIEAILRKQSAVDRLIYQYLNGAPDGPLTDEPGLSEF
jgi:hypothetical protein